MPAGVAKATYGAKIDMAQVGRDVMNAKPTTVVGLSGTPLKWSTAHEKSLRNPTYLWVSVTGILATSDSISRCPLSYRCSRDARRTSRGRRHSSGLASPPATNPSTANRSSTSTTSAATAATNARRLARARTTTSISRRTEAALTRTTSPPPQS